MPDIGGIGPVRPGRPSGAGATEVEIDTSTPNGQTRLQMILSAMSPQDASRTGALIEAAQRAGVTRFQVPTLETVRGQRYQDILNNFLTNLQAEIQRNIGQ